METTEVKTEVEKSSDDKLLKKMFFVGLVGAIVGAGFVMAYAK